MEDFIIFNFVTDEELGCIDNAIKIKFMNEVSKKLNLPIRKTMERVHKGRQPYIELNISDILEKKINKQIKTIHIKNIDNLSEEKMRILDNLVEGLKEINEVEDRIIYLLGVLGGLAKTDGTESEVSGEVKYDLHEEKLKLKRLKYRFNKK